MYKYIFTIALLMVMQKSFGYEELEIEKKSVRNVNLSFGLASGGSIGIGKIQQYGKSTKEMIFNVHYLVNQDYFVTGVYGQINSFRNEHRKGFFTVIIAGLDYNKGESYPLFVYGPDSSEEKLKFDGLHPNITLGLGYSIPISQKNRVLFFLDLRFKKTISNLNFSISY